MSEPNVFLVLSDGETFDNAEGTFLLETTNEGCCVECLCRDTERAFSIEKMYQVLKQNNLLEDCQCDIP
jgi:hypothetical protein